MGPLFSTRFMARFTSDFSLGGRPYRGWWFVSDRLFSYVVHILLVSLSKV